MNQLAFDFGVIALDDYDEDGHAQVQTDSPGTAKETGTQPFTRIMPLGFYSRALDPEKGEDGTVGLGASCITMAAEDDRYALPLNDPRDVNEGRVPKLRKGGAMMAGGAGAYRSFISIDGLDPTGAKQSGSIQAFASYSSGGAKKSLAFAMNVRDAGLEYISFVHGAGSRWTMDKDGVSTTSPNGKHFMHVTNNGNVLAGDTKVQGSMVVGQQLAAQPVANATVLAQALSALASVVATMVGGTAAPAAIAPFLPLLGTQHLKST